MVEYYSGIFAASKTEDPNDDRLVPLLWLIKGMSSDQLRTHYIFYKIIYSIFQGNTTINIGDDTYRRKCRVLIPSSVYLNSMERWENELEKIIDHCLPALVNKGLIEQSYCFGSKEILQKFCPKQSLLKEIISGIIIEPNCNDAELFLAAHGRKDILSSQIFEIPELISSNDLISIKGDGIPIFPN